jgi:ferritin-like protein
MSYQIEMEVIAGQNSEVADAVIGYDLDLDGNLDSVWSISGCSDFDEADVRADIKEYLENKRP